MKPGLLSPLELQTANEVLQWAKEYLVKEHPHIQRPEGSQVVCPFVGPAIANDSLYMAFHSEVSSGRRAEEMIEEIMLATIKEFANLGPEEPSGRWKKALLVIFPRLPDPQTRALDRAHASLKDSYVAAGLMLGQFHRNCDERSVHNGAFPVSRSPVPLMAVRYMARHDILFLHSRKEWFRRYDELFGAAFKRPNRIPGYERYLVRVYRDAKQRFGSE